eukprot:scaffold162241_cov31-Tisochrysis_lutea.AAC.3
MTLKECVSQPEGSLGGSSHDSRYGVAPKDEGKLSLATTASLMACSVRMEPTGQATAAAAASTRSAPLCGCVCTKDLECSRPKMCGAIHRQVSQSMQLLSTKKLPGALAGKRRRAPLTAIAPEQTAARLTSRAREREARGIGVVGGAEGRASGVQTARGEEGTMIEERRGK